MISGVMKEVGSAGLPSQLSLVTSAFPGLAAADLGKAAASPKPGNSVASRPAKPLRVKRFESILSSPLGDTQIRSSVSLDAFRSRQRERENIVARRDRHILLAQDFVTHGRSMKFLAGGEMPQWLAGFRVHSLERFSIIAKENQSACGGHHTTGRIAFTRLRIAPFKRAGIKIVGHQHFLALCPSHAAHAGSVIRPAFSKTLWLPEERSTILEREKIKKMRVGIVCRRIPVRGPGKTGTDQRAVCRRLDSRQDRAPLPINALGPIQLLDERHRRQKFSVNAVDYVQKSVAIRL